MLEINKIICGDCIEVMRGFPDNSFDGIVTDPPYGLGFMGKEWDTFKEKSVVAGVKSNIGNGTIGERGRNDTSPAWVAARYDHSRNAEFQQWFTVWAAEALRIVKPGGIMLIFGGTRTYHRLTCAIEDAGWEIRDCMMWLYGSGFPKSTSISLQFDKTACREQLEKELGRKPTKEELKKAWEGFRKVVGKRDGTYADIRRDKETGIAELHGGIAKDKPRIESIITAPATTLAKLWDGYGTALKPAWEPIVVAMKPLNGTFAANAEKHGVAGLNIDGGRIGLDGEKCPSGSGKNNAFRRMEGREDRWIGSKTQTPPQGRWPANLILDEEAAAMLDEQSGVTSITGKRSKQSQAAKVQGTKWLCDNHNSQEYGGDSGGASRFFYCAKASRAERNAGLEGMERKAAGSMVANQGKVMDLGGASLKGEHKQIKPVQNTHPTIKPLALMEYLCKLLKPPTEHPILLDPFCGSGTTLMAAVNTGWDYIGIEKEKEYCEIAEKRVAYIKEQNAGLFTKGD